MFFREVKAKNETYLRLVQSVRRKGKVVQKVLINFGNTKTLKPEFVNWLNKELSKFAGLPAAKTLADVHHEESLDYGDCLLINHFWDKLDLSRLIKRALEKTEVEIDVALLTKIMVINRLKEPKSKLGVQEWYEDNIFLEDIKDKKFPVHQFYRALEYLHNIKYQLESWVYYNLCDLFNQKVTLVFYDLTSTYFEGTQCPISVHGNSKDHRPDLKQIQLGLLINDEGIPIGHKVFLGNTSDKSTVPEVLEELKHKYCIKKLIFVGDKGLVSASNLNEIGSQGYEYILNLKLRKSNEVKEILKFGDDLSTYTKVKENLLIKEHRLAKLRYLFCYNPENAPLDKASRERRIKKAETGLKKILSWTKKGKTKPEKEVVAKVERLLNKTFSQKYFEYGYDRKQGLTYQLLTKPIKDELRLDGKFILKTNSLKITQEEIVFGYKTLVDVEVAFREIKDFLRLRPIYVHSEESVRGHVFVCVLAYLIEKLLERELKNKDIELSAQKALAELKKIKLTTDILGNTKLRIRSNLSSQQEKILKKLDIDCSQRVFAY